MKKLLRCNGLHKKGFELSLKAIFTMIAGAAILLFFMQFAFDQQTVQETVQTREALVDLDDQLDAFTVSQSSAQTIKLPKKAELQFTCQGMQLGDYARTDEKLIFSESYTTDRLNAWTLRWEFPFPIANAIYLDVGRRYILVYDQNSMNEVKELDIPDIFSAQKQDIRNFNADRLKAELGGKKATLAFFTAALPAGTDKISADIIKVNMNTNELDINGEQTFYLGKPMLLGAIFGPSAYACTQEQAIERMHLVSTLHAQRASLLALKATRACKNNLFAAQQTLTLLSQATLKEQLYALQEKIAQQNKELEKDGCATIY